MNIEHRELFFSYYFYNEETGSRRHKNSHLPEHKPIHTCKKHIDTFLYMYAYTYIRGYTVYAYIHNTRTRRLRIMYMIIQKCPQDEIIRH